MDWRGQAAQPTTRVCLIRLNPAASLPQPSRSGVRLDRTPRDQNSHDRRSHCPLDQPIVFCLCSTSWEAKRHTGMTSWTGNSLSASACALTQPQMNLHASGFNDMSVLATTRANRTRSGLLRRHIASTFDLCTLPQALF